MDLHKLNVLNHVEIINYTTCIPLIIKQIPQIINPIIDQYSAAIAENTVIFFDEFSAAALNPRTPKPTPHAKDKIVINHKIKPDFIFSNS